MKVSNNLKLIIVGLIIVGLIGYYIATLKDKAKKGPKVKLPNNGGGIPKGWQPITTAAKLRNYVTCYFCTGTNGLILSTIGELSNDQLAAVVNYYNDYYTADLIQDIYDDLSGSDLATAQEIFKRIQ